MNIKTQSPRQASTLAIALLAAIAALSPPAAAQTKAPPTSTSLTDPQSGQKYRTVNIGNLQWMAENLNTATELSWCYGDVPSGCAKWGRLYTWKAAIGACADLGGGWRLPTWEDWDDLVSAIGGTCAPGRKLKAKNGGWYYKGNGTDDYGFSALPSGHRFTGDGTSRFGGQNANWWSASVTGRDAPSYRGVNTDNESGVYELGDDVDAWYGHAVRCVSGNLAKAAGAVLADTSRQALGAEKKPKGDGSEVRIGNLTWMSKNLNVETPDSSWCYDGDPANCAKYGRLYTWKSAKSACASLGGSWRLPTRTDWRELVSLAGGRDVAGKKLKSKAGWSDDRSGKGGNGIDDYGFSALPGGRREHDNHVGKNFQVIGEYGEWWSTKEFGCDGAGAWSVGNRDNIFSEDHKHKSDGYSVRCVSE